MALFLNSRSRIHLKIILPFPMEDKFTWTQEYKKSWEDDKIESKATKHSAAYQQYSPYSKNIIRHLHLVIDTSLSIEKPDYLPTVRNQITRLVPLFVEQFSRMNPLSMLSFMTCKDTFQKFSKIFDAASLLNVVGNDDFSFLNCLRAAVEVLRNSSHTKECLVITASIGTKDNGSFDEILKDIKKYNVKINLISICGDISIFKKICEVSNGKFYVPLNVNHFEIILNYFSYPMESTETTNALIKFGFPNIINTIRVTDKTTQGVASNSGLCACHLTFHNSNYECPICKAFICTIPTQCPICDTQLISPLNISKSYHYMYPLKPFDVSGGVCRNCARDGTNRCTECGTVYCEECSDFLQGDLNFCLYCS